MDFLTTLNGYSHFTYSYGPAVTWNRVVGSVAIICVTLTAFMIFGNLHAYAMSNGTTVTSSAGDQFPPLVFIPGFKGSVLSDSKGRRNWLTWRQALGLSTPKLSLPLRWEGDIQHRDALLPLEPIRKIAWKDIYAPFMDWVVESGRELHCFAYDWRRDNIETTDNFVLFLEQVSRQHENAKVQIVGHSMGGLIGFVALKRRPDLIHSALFAGAPFGPTITFLKDFHVGTPIGLNNRILSPPVQFSFVSPYCLFPTDLHQSGLRDRNGNPIVHDWYSAEGWERLKLGIFSLNEPPNGWQPIREHLRFALSRAKEFRSLLTCNKHETIKYPPIAILASDAHITLSGVVQGGRGAVRGWNFKNTLNKPGDGRVPFDAAKLPEEVPHEVYRTTQKHGFLLNDVRIVSEIFTGLFTAP